jgi:rhodanese-related sulfurtransferase
VLTVFRSVSLLLLAACSVFDSGVPLISQQELLQQIEAKSDMLILDVRTSDEFRSGHIPGAYHIDHRDIESRINEIEPYRNRPVIVYCYSGIRAGIVESYLIEQGFSRIRHLEGDWSAWESNALPSE